MADFVGEPITPHAGTFDTQPMSRGEPGLPTGFDWRDRAVGVVNVLSAWKESSREGGRARGELYLRRHYFKLGMSDGSIWTVSFLRQTPRSGNPKKRWYLYTVEPGPGQRVE